VVRHGLLTMTRGQRWVTDNDVWSEVGY
jgi:hypothetical protein